MSPEQAQTLVARALEENPLSRAEESELVAFGALTESLRNLGDLPALARAPAEFDEQATRYRMALAWAVCGAALSEQRAAELRAQEAT